MSTLTGKIQVFEQVTIECDGKTYQVHAAGSGPEAASNAHTINVFRSLHNKTVRLAGDVTGDVIDGATLDGHTASVSDGLYHGRIESSSGDTLTVDLRLEQEQEVVSADFFSGGTYLASIRSHIQSNGGKWVGTNPRFIMDRDDASTLAGNISIEAISSDALTLECTLPFSLPRNFSGTVSFESEHFRVLNIEVDKLSGMPWPPQFTRSSIPDSVAMPATAVSEFSMETLFAHSGIEARDRKSVV